MNDEGLIKLIEMLIKDTGISGNLNHKLRLAIHPTSHLIAWHEEDMDELAEHFEDVAEPEDKVKYDRQLIPYAMEMMIDNHDASMGISHDTLRFYLDEYCRDYGEE